MEREDGRAAVGIIGGSGLYRIEGLEDARSVAVTTPFGDPSDPVVVGVLEGRRVCFLPRHGGGHRMLPHEINHRANLWALRSLGVRWLISVSAVGSLREWIRPLDLLVPDQLIDRTGTGAKHTFFGNGIAAHVGFADPYCSDLRRVLVEAAREEAGAVHDGGAYLCMNGPAFSTRAEAAMHRASTDAAVIGMTNAPEARLAREAEIAAATLALVTDYDCWKTDQKPVDAGEVIANLARNTDLAKRVLKRAVAMVPEVPGSAAHGSLDGAIYTDPALWPEQTVGNLRPILGRFLQGRSGGDSA